MNQKLSPRIPYPIIGLVVVLLLVGVALWIDAARPSPEAFHHWHRPYQVEPGTIQDWMTFEYLNLVFKLPPEYLENTLSIEGNQYPRISIRQYAESSGVNEAAFLSKVQEAVASYTAQGTP